MTKEFENLNLLLFYRWKRSYKFYGIVFALYLAFCLFALLMKGEQLGWVRYEVYFGSRPCLLLFLAALSVVIVYQVATLLYMQLRSNALHRYLILPQSRVPFMLSELLMNISAIVILLLLQYAVYYIGYRYYMTLAPFYNLKNGFYLSIVRSGMLKYLFPLTITQLLIIVSSIVTVSAMTVYLGVYYQRLQSYILCIANIAGVLFVWGMPSGIQFDVQRGMQLALMMVLAGLMVLSFRNSMNRNQYGGR